jgi:putative transposase
VTENVFGRLKEELFNHSRFDTVEEFTTAPDEYPAGTTPPASPPR